MWWNVLTVALVVLAFVLIVVVSAGGFAPWRTRSDPVGREVLEEHRHRTGERGG
jgi:hypothetical protein